MTFGYSTGGNGWETAVGVEENSVYVWIKGGEASRGKVQIGWKWPVGLLGSAQITGNQMGATHPPLNLHDFASKPSIQRNLSYFELYKTDISLKCKARTE